MYLLPPSGVGFRFSLFVSISVCLYMCVLVYLFVYISYLQLNFYLVYVTYFIISVSGDCQQAAELLVNLNSALFLDIFYIFVYDVVETLSALPIEYHKPIENALSWRRFAVSGCVFILICNTV